MATCDRVISATNRVGKDEVEMKTFLYSWSRKVRSWHFYVKSQGESVSLGMKERGGSRSELHNSWSEPELVEEAGKARRHRKTPGDLSTFHKHNKWFVDMR